MTATNGKVEEFFKKSAAPLLARDAKAAGGMCSVPSLILFPGGRPPERASCRLVDSTEGYRTAVLTLMA